MKYFSQASAGFTSLTGQGYLQFISIRGGRG
uniref:Uncharacterized protein n=1 Tax=Anguilla anguilla TaxID=7936 RepID=A0A0E9VA40_ANGAN